MSLSASLFGRDSLIFKATNILGLGIPGMLDRWANPEQPGQKLGDISQQTAKEAEPRVIVYGRVRPIAGNIIHCQEPIKKMVRSSGGGGGKGGGGSKPPKTEHVFRSYAIGVCEGPIGGFIRIWRNNKLVYDARASTPENIEWGNKNNPVFLKNFRLYLGAWSQLPDPTLESIWGVGNVPGYRGTAYMVAINEDLTDFGGGVPQWLFEVERGEGVFLTSKPYAVEAIDEVGLGPVQNLRTPPSAMTADFLQLGGAVLTAGYLRDPLITYGNWPPEGVEVLGTALVAGTLRGTQVTYGDWPPEAVDVLSTSLTAGTLRNGVVSYDNWPAEALDFGATTLTEGSLT